MSRRRDFRRMSRGLRFRLTAGYALLFMLLFALVSLYLREHLASSLDDQVVTTVERDWASMKGYMRIEVCPELDHQITTAWYYDQDDTDETTAVFNLRRIFMVADRYGNPIRDCASQQLAVSTAYQDIGPEKPELIRKQLQDMLTSPKLKVYMNRKTSDGEPVKVRAGIVYAEGHGAPYYVAVGELYTEKVTVLHKFTWIFAGVIPGSLILGSLVGFFMAGRALSPVLEVARAAQRISGLNLGLRIPTREAGDELDYLILTFNRMIERLEQSFQQMKQFSTDVSHELRTPITAIRGQLEVALFTAQTTDQYREAMFNALQDIDRLSQIVRALLLLSQAESGQLVLQKTRLDLREVASDLVEQFQIPAEAAGVKLTADLPDECPAEVDRVQIERLITNLLSNAIKFTPEGGRVRLALRSGADGAEIVVEDTGRGIPTEHLPHIFDRFYRVPGKGTAPGPDQGLGLGLSFVAWIVKAHGGTIDVDSTPGKGTRFTIHLPAEPIGSDTLELVGQA